MTSASSVPFGVMFHGAAPSNSPSDQCSRNHSIILPVDNEKGSESCYVRRLRWFLLGLTLHGPFFFWGMRRLDSFFGVAKNMSVVVKKTAAAQTLLFPPYLCLLLPLLGLMEGRVTSWKEALSDLSSRFPHIFSVGCCFWPAANVINFFCVPPSGRVLYLAGAGCVWNTFLSWQNSTLHIQ
eukprot:GHVQ01029310.1.p1 GENE.GHVQ01029310.1~~GHVQ01029310.1.p1  ORF type:complete len:181 (+),score=11.70 GHVQ01029310.1:636-1178(+)